MNAKSITKLVVMLGICFSMGLQGCNADANPTGEEFKKGTGHKKKDYPVQPVSFSDVKVTDDFWAGRIQTETAGWISGTLALWEETGRRMWTKENESCK